MHEMSLAEGVLRILEEQAEAQGFNRVSTVRLEIGALSHVDPDALSFCLQAVLKGSLAETAAVEIEKTPGEGWCLGCSRSVPVAALYDPCPHCGGYQVQVTGGTEMRVRELEVE
jgi:hydrogenase nickel incorporation protein HypA/HybF